MEINLINKLPVAIYWVDEKNIYQGCNDALAKLFGLSSPEDIINKRTIDLPVFKENPEAAVNLDKENLNSLLSTKQQVSEQIIEAEKETIYLSVRSPILNFQNAVTGLTVMLIDITGYKNPLESKNDLKNTTIALENILENLPGHVYWKDLKGRYLGCNLAQAKSAGFSSISDTIGKTDYEMPWKREQAELYNRNDKKVIETGVPILTEEEITLENGITHTYLANKTPLRDKEKRIVGVLGISLDMTHQKKILDRLQKENINNKIALENILNNLPGHVYWKDLNGCFLGCNFLQAQSGGFTSSSEMVGKSDYEMPWKDQADLFKKNDQHVIRTGLPIQAEEKIKLKSGELLTVLSNKIPLRNERKEIIGVLGISLDISEQKKMQAALKKAEGQIEGMTLVSAAMAHELRTPLATITMGMQGIEKYLQSLIDAYQIAQEHQLSINPIPARLLTNLSNAVGNIKTEAKNANMVVNMLLANLSFQAGKLPTEKLSMLECIENALKQYPFSGDKQKLVHVDSNHDFVFEGEMLLFSHILFNLLKNSLYFIDKVGKGEIYISLHEEHSFNSLHFKDTGQGIKKQDLPLIFEQFFTKDTHHGTGIGLAFCKAVLDSWGGSITCHSEYGKYAEFNLNFPKKI